MTGVIDTRGASPGFREPPVGTLVNGEDSQFAGTIAHRPHLSLAIACTIVAYRQRSAAAVGVSCLGGRNRSCQTRDT
jgi:hypothetical protein